MTLREWIKACRTCIACNACIGVVSGFALAWYVQVLEGPIVDFLSDGLYVIPMRPSLLFMLMSAFVGVVLASCTSRLLEWNDRGPYWAVVGVGLVFMAVAFSLFCGVEASSALMTVRAVALGAALLASCLTVVLARYVEA